MDALRKELEGEGVRGRGIDQDSKGSPRSEWFGIVENVLGICVFMSFPSLGGSSRMRSPKRDWSTPWRVLVSRLPSMGPSRAHLGRLWAALRAPWSSLGAPLGTFLVSFWHVRTWMLTGCLHICPWGSSRGAKSSKRVSK